MARVERHLIDEFFQSKVPQQLGYSASRSDAVCGEEVCLQFVRGRLQILDAVPVDDNQGSNSFTLISTDTNTIIQFCLKPFRTDVLALAHEIYGELVPRRELHTGFPLPVYTSNVIPGRVYFLQNFPDIFPLARQLNTVTDLGKFVAKAAWHPQMEQYEGSSWTQQSAENIRRLIQNRSLEELAPELLPLIREPETKLHLLNHLPLVLTHHDLAEISILVDEEGHVTGVIDFDAASIEAFGVCVWGIYECFLGSMEKGEWSFFNQAANDSSGASVQDVLEAAFWETLWSSVPPSMRTGEIETAVRVAVQIGVVQRYFIDGMLDCIDVSKQKPRYSLAYARGILPAIR